LFLTLFGVLAGTTSASAWTVVAPVGVELRAVAVDRSGNAIVAGSRRIHGTQSVYVSKHSTGGSLLWELHPDAIAGDARAVAAAPGGNVYVVGSETHEQDRTTVLAVCLNGVDGRLLWRCAVSPPNVGGAVLEGSADACAVGPRGELVVGGSVRTDNGTSAIVARLAPGDGNSVWTWAAAQSTVTALGIDRRGDVLATGSFMVAAKLRGTDGAVQWRINSPAPKFQERGYPQMRSLALDSRGNVTIGGGLRNTLEDTRAFYMTTLAAGSGRRLSEDAGPSLYTDEASARVQVAGRTSSRPAASTASRECSATGPTAARRSGPSVRGPWTMRRTALSA